MFTSSRVTRRRLLVPVGALAAALAALAAVAQEPRAPKPSKGAAADGSAEGNTAAVLIEQLKHMPEVGMPDELTKQLERDLTGERRAEYSFRAAGSSTRSKKSASRPPVRLLQKRAWQTLGLTARTGDECQLAKGPADELQHLSGFLRASGCVSLADGRGQMVPPKNIDLDKALYQANKSIYASTVPTLVQMLQVEGETTRINLIKALEADDEPADAALAQRALFDHSVSVRRQAIAALAKRPRERYRTYLMAGFRHPWRPAARHAAEALVGLADRPAIPALKKMLDEPDPTATVSAEGKPAIRELVRINHLKNCLLCHAPAMTGREPVVGRVPVSGKALPSGVVYYASRESFPDDILVRADITYLRQDFSVMLPVKDAKPWPEMQRFDFLIRTRPATAEELAAQKGNKARSPQREAILHALNGLK